MLSVACCFLFDFIHFLNLMAANIAINVKRQVTQIAIRPGVLSAGTKNESQLTNTRSVLGM